MNASSLIEQLLKAGTTVVGQQVDAARGSIPQADMGKYAKGAAVGGLLGLLLGSSSGRRLGGSAMRLGSVAAMGMLAWKTYQEWQAKQAGQAPVPAAGAPAANTQPTFEALPAPQKDAHGQAMLKAMIAAAKADGHVDAREQGLLDAELQRTAADPALRVWLQAELAKPLDAADVASAAKSPEMAAEIYLASLLVVDETNSSERAYLDTLASKLGLAAELKSSLEARAAGR